MNREQLIKFVFDTMGEILIDFKPEQKVDPAEPSAVFVHEGRRYRIWASKKPAGRPDKPGRWTIGVYEIDGKSPWHQNKLAAHLNLFIGGYVENRKAPHKTIAEKLHRLANDCSSVGHLRNAILIKAVADAIDAGDGYPDHVLLVDLIRLTTDDLVDTINGLRGEVTDQGVEIDGLRVAVADWAEAIGVRDEQIAGLANDLARAKESAPANLHEAIAKARGSSEPPRQPATFATGLGAAILSEESGPVESEYPDPAPIPIKPGEIYKARDGSTLAYVESIKKIIDRPEIVVNYYERSAKEVLLPNWTRKVVIESVFRHLFEMPSEQVDPAKKSGHPGKDSSPQIKDS